MINKELQKKIVKMAKIDQGIRKSRRVDLRRMSEIDKKNTKEMKKIIKKYGWPDTSLVGRKGVQRTWLLVQHADFDVKFQKKCLDLLKKESIKNKESLSYVAYLTDRVRVNDGKHQIFGTQFYRDKDGFLKPKPIINIKNLESRRKKYGLKPFKEYEKLMDKVFNKKD